MNDSKSPRIAVVIPAYKQPQYLKDAVLSALRQTVVPSARVVIVNDGCPYLSTDVQGRAFQDAYPETVRYLRQPNGGLSAARNAGIRFALDVWPSVFAVFPLDADDRISPHALELLWSKLASSPPRVGWAYPDANIFNAWRYSSAVLTGANEPVEHIRFNPQFSLFRLTHENLCVASSLIRREVFEAGVWYDEEMKSGYEDWEFYLSAALHGFSATYVSDAGFWYRRRGYSMLAGAQDKHQAIHRSILHKHRSRLASDSLTQIEHRELPRFAIVPAGGATVSLGTHAAGNERCDVPLATSLREIDAWIEDAPGESHYVPPITVFAHEAVLGLLEDSRLLPGVMLSLQRALKHVDVALLHVAIAPLAMTIEFVEDSSAGNLAVLAVSLPKWIDMCRRFTPEAGATLLRLSVEKAGGDATRSQAVADLMIEHGFDSESTTLWIGERHLSTDVQDFLRHGSEQSGPTAGSGERQNGVPGEAKMPEVQTLEPPLDEERQSPRHHRYHVAEAALPILREIGWSGSRPGPPLMHSTSESFSLSHTEWMHQVHIQQGATTFPWFARHEVTQPTHIVLAISWLRLLEADRCVLHVTKALRELRGNYFLHLVITTTPAIEVDPGHLRIFDTVTFLSGGKSERDATLESVLALADVVVNIGSRECYEVLPRLKQRSRASWVSYVDDVDQGGAGQLSGYPALATRYDDLIDYHVAPSRRLRRWFQSMGVPDDKILVVPNAPRVTPGSFDKAVALTQRKSRRRYDDAQPLRVLFTGQLAHQTGADRLSRISMHVTASSVPVEFVIFGPAAGLEADRFAAEVPGGRFVPLTADQDELARHFEEADVLLLPSRRDGVPWSALDAMTFGIVVVATRVGGIEEIVHDRRTGILVDADQSEDALAVAFSDVLADIATDPTKYADLRQVACRTALGRTWASAAAALAELIDGARQHRFYSTAVRSPAADSLE